MCDFVYSQMKINIYDKQTIINATDKRILLRANGKNYSPLVDGNASTAAVQLKAVQ